MSEIKGIVWHGTTTEQPEPMVRFCTEVLGLNAAAVQADGITRFELANGDAFVVAPKAPGSAPSVYDGPAMGFLVANVDAAYQAMAAKGVDFLGPVHRGTSQTWAQAWVHFRAPDGHVYALVSRSDSYPGGNPRRFRELRVCMAVEDLAPVKALWGDGLGLTVVDSWTHPGGEQGLLFEVMPAALEFVTDASNTAFAGESHSTQVPVALSAEVGRIDDVAAEVAAAGVAEISAGSSTGPADRKRRFNAGQPQGLSLDLFELTAEQAKARQAERDLLPK
jgi:catechol 2,3-dioxygenase-like lactoylglutathione lyase family enzyme